MISGIPYFGEGTQSITENILKSKIEYSKNYNSLYDLILNHINEKIIVVIDNKWLTWLTDITFNYRDKECYIPYYSYKLHKLNNKSYKSNNKGHLILEDNALYIRHEYKYEKLYLDINNLSLVLFDLDTMEKYEAKTNKWINEQYFDIDKLYNLYINSCYIEDDFNFNKHMGGYHYILRAPQGFKNREKNIREELNLQHFNTLSIYDTDYRDVRNFKYEEVIQKEGLRNSIELYKIRRLKFESYLYCSLRQGLNPSNKNFLIEWQRLLKGKDYIKYGNNIKLIFKNYWLNNSKQINNKKTWSRI